MHDETQNPTTDESTVPSEENGASTVPRRSFLMKAGATLVGGIVSLFPLGVGVFAFLDPLKKKKEDSESQNSGSTAADSEGFYRVTTLDSLPESGEPRFFKIISDSVDAWTVYRDVPIGSVYLRKLGEKEVIAFNVSCPHAGCAVSFRPKKDHFFCPCHNSSFALNGDRSPDSPSHRDLDSLKVEIREGNEVWVKYQNFRAGTEEKIAEA